MSQRMDMGDGRQMIATAIMNLQLGGTILLGSESGEYRKNQQRDCHAPI